MTQISNADFADFLCYLRETYYDQVFRSIKKPLSWEERPSVASSAMDFESLK